jgi:hypothetical protein
MNPMTRRKTLNAVLTIVVYTLVCVRGSGADLRVAQIQPKDHRVVLRFPINRDQAEDLQRWVNAGHDPWCRDPQLVAASALGRISTQSSEFEPTSVQLESNEKSRAVYTFHSLDGYTTYRIALRRYRFLLRTAGSFQRIIWIPETAEILSRATNH